jgi:FlaA1/EpsC-like NDP-sugar epimerase
MTNLKNKNILIVGGTGSWGQELTKQLLNNSKLKKIIIYSRTEPKQVYMKRKFQDPRIEYIIGDIRDKEQLSMAMKNIDFVFHLAALKHVPICEENPEETVKTNIEGTMNIVHYSIKNKVEKVVLISTDKAVDPINTYGVSKSMAEKIIIGGNYKDTKTKFVCIRAGNVLGSDGSVVPLFIEQIKNLNKMTLTDKRMTRYLMTLREAISLIYIAFEKSLGGEIFVTKMPIINIIDLAKVMKKELGNSKTQILEIGIRPGEKLYELLVSKYELYRTIDYDKFFIILPTIEKDNLLKKWKGEKLKEEYNSLKGDFLDHGEIKNILKKEGWLDEENQKVHEFKEIKTKKSLLNLLKVENWK